MNDLDFDEAVREAQAVVAAGKSRRPRLCLVGLEERIFTASRERKARLMDGLAVALLLALMAAIGAIIVILAAPAQAAPDPVAVQYAANYADAVCATLDLNPSTNGVHGVMQGIEGHGLTRPQAAYAMVLSVVEACPANAVLITAFIDRWSGPVTV